MGTSRRLWLHICLCAGFVLVGVFPGQAQDSAGGGSSDSSALYNAVAQLRALTETVHDLQAQVRALNAEVAELRIEAKTPVVDAKARTASVEALETAPSVSSAQPEGLLYASLGAPTLPLASTKPDMPPRQGPANLTPGLEERLSRIDEGYQLIDSKLAGQDLTKVESGSKYRLRLSGIVLVNLYENRGTVDNQDFPNVALPMPLLGSGGAFGGSLRQSQIGLQTFGPDIAGAHTSADLKLDFAGGVSDAPNGATMGIARLRTATARLDWSHTSLVIGQDRLFFAPLSPTSLASLAIPALSYAGNLWSWTPQIRVEHRVDLSEQSKMVFQVGVLDSFSGDVPDDQGSRDPSWGEQSGQPAYAARVAWSHKALGEELTLGGGGYYGRQGWGFRRKVDGWAGMVDLTVPLGKMVALTTAFYRGRAVAGLGGGIGQDIIVGGNFAAPTGDIEGLDSVGGWVQLKVKPTSKLEINGAFGDDNPFSSDLRRFGGGGSYFGPALSKNLSPFINFIYQVRSNVLFSTEYREIHTWLLNDGSVTAHHVTFNMGYLF